MQDGHLGGIPTIHTGESLCLNCYGLLYQIPEAFVLPDQKCETVANDLIKGMFSRFGVLQSIHSDQESYFECRVVSMC